MGMKRILMTGCAGYLGSKVVALLAGRGGYEIYGMDVKRPAEMKAYRRFALGSVTDAAAMWELFDSARPDVAVHLAFVVLATHDSRLEESVAIGGTHDFLACLARAAVPKAVFLSSAAAYGAHDDNDTPLTESSPVRGVAGYGYSRLKGEADHMARDFMAAHGECEFSILRPCLFVGPNTRNNFFDVLSYPLVPQIVDGKGARDPLFQFIHEDDMAACLAAAIEKPARGIYNVAADGEAPFTELIERFGKRAVAVPAWILYPAVAILWRLRLVTSPPAQLDFIRYPWVMDNGRMKRELYQPTKTSIEAFDDFARVRGTGISRWHGNMP